MQVEAMPLEPSPAHIDDVMITAEELAVRWQLSTGTLANLRARGEGLPFVKLPSGAIRYRAVDVLAAEEKGAFGFSWDKLADALGEKLDPADAQELLKHLKKRMRN